MIKWRRLNSSQLAILLLGGLAATDVLIWLAQFSGAWPLQVAVFLSLSFLPGLILLRALRLSFSQPVEALVYSFGLSVLSLMLSGLGTNQVGRLIGIARPLDLANLLIGWNLLVVFYIVLSSFANQADWAWPKFKLSLSKFTIGVLVLASFLPILAAMGAFRLNNGGDAVMAGLALAYAALLMAYVFMVRDHLTEPSLAWFIFCLGLAILLMTSLRSWDISGHDITREFQVYNLTNLQGFWSMGAIRSAYNACLSITILPESYAQMLGLSGVTVFKLILQVIFATCPVAIYLLVRRYLGRLGSLVAATLYISYSTFITDSAMLTRQGVAYLFFTLAIMIILQRTMGRKHQLLFLLCAGGVILSHYSTSYMFVAIFGLAMLGKLGLEWLKKPAWAGQTISSLTILSPFYGLLLLLATFLWYGQLTATAGGLVSTLQGSVANIPRLLAADNKSSDTSAALLFAISKSPLDIYQSYLEDPKLTINPTQAPQYTPQLAGDEIPLTSLGQNMRSIGLNPDLITSFRQAFAKLLQLLAVVGVGWVGYWVWRSKKLGARVDLLCLSLAGIILLGMIVVLPTFSLNYGILRSFQQSLIFLIIPMLLPLAWAGQRLRPRPRTASVALSMVAVFLIFTGFVAQILGGVGATLSLNNRGLYHGLYYVTQADLNTFEWTKTHLPKGTDVRAASHAPAIMHDPHYPFTRLGILPSQTTIHSYVHLNQAQQVSQKFYTYHQGSPLITSFPLNYYQEQTNHIYSTPSTGVYH